MVQVVLPPLRKRENDVILLLQSFPDKLAIQQGRDALRCSPDVLEHLTRYSWPGNVRELFNCARYLTGLTVGEVAQLSDLPPRIREASPGPNLTTSPTPATDSRSSEPSARVDAPAIRYDLAYKPAKRMWLEVFEYAYISRLLEKHNGNISHAARAAGIDRKSIQRLMKRNLMTSNANEDHDSD